MFLNLIFSRMFFASWTYEFRLLSGKGSESAEQARWLKCRPSTASVQGECPWANIVID